MPSDLDFISKPNPVEPSDLSHGNLSVHQLDRSTNEHLMPFLLNNRLSQQRRDAPLDVTQPTRQLKQSFGLPISDVLNRDESTDRTPPRSDQTLYTLPKLPVKRGTKRHRVPPVLQGLHEPPPTSRILPSISAEDTQVLLPSTRTSRSILNEPYFVEQQELPPVNVPEVVTSEPKPVEDKPTDKRAFQRNKWSEQETDDLLRGVAKFGIGSWKKILLCPEYSFNKRTAVDLKDRFRVCKPNVYGNPRTKKAKRALEAETTESEVTSAPLEGFEGSSNSRTTTVVYEVNDDAPQEAEEEITLWKVKRRKRRRFTEEEDQALLRGYEEYGASWQSIQKDPIFQSTNRTPTDLRDRFRTKFPDIYAKAGLVPRPANFPKPLPRSGMASDEQPESNSAKEITVPAPVQEISRSFPPVPHWHPQGPQSAHSMAHRPHVLPLPRIVDDFMPGLNFPDEDEEGDAPIILDRSIVDWANSNKPPNRPASYVEGGNFPGIDPLITQMSGRF